MPYIKSNTGKWHRDDCEHLESPVDSKTVRDQLPLHEPHCETCIDGFEFDRTASTTHSTTD